MTDEIGRVLGDRYRLVAPVGMGASAQVFLADDVRLRRRVAVKLLHPALVDDQDFLRRFRTEVQAAAALRHPHIVVTHDWGDDGGAYIVSEYLAGGSLRGLLDRGNRLTPSQALQVGLAAARALEYAHSRGMVHRAVKPSNVLFGDDGRMRIADFGLARALAEAAWTEPQGSVLGTARYAAPEQARGQSLGGRADVYALALVLVEAVTGKVPFASDTVIGTLMARVDHDLEVPAELGPLREPLERAGRSDPDQRLDAAGLATALMAVAGMLPHPGALPLAGAIADDHGPGDDVRDPTLIVLPEAPVPDPPPPSGGATNGALAAGSAVLLQPDPVPVVPVEHAGPGPAAVAAALAAAAAGAATSAAPAADAKAPKVYDAALEDDDESAPAKAPALAGAAATAGATTRAEAAPAGPAMPVAAAQATKEPDGRPRRTRVLWIVLGALLLVAAASGTALAVLADRTPTHPVPTLAATQAAATRQLTALGFKVHAEHLRRDGTKPGQVLGSRPPAGRRVAEGHTVTLLVSDGPTLVKVPAHLAGKPEAAAVAFLKHQGLMVAPSQHQYSETVAAATVLSYVGSPPAQLPRGSTVRLLVSAGPKPRVLPDVSGLTPAQAAQQLTNLGLVPVTVKQFSDSVDSGGLIGLNPASGQTVGRGSTVQVIVSKGPELVAVPSMKGVKTIQDAIAALEAVGLVPGAAHGGLSSRPKAFDPGSGTMVPKGSTVDIILHLL
jgi:serine/threonine-protein kinase